MTPDQYLEKFKDGYPHEEDSLPMLSKKEVREKVGKGSFWKVYYLNHVGRYNGGLKALNDFLGEKDPHKVVSMFEVRNGHLILDFEMENGFTKKFALLGEEIEHIAVIAKVQETGTRQTQGNVGGTVGGLLLGPVGRLLGQELTKRTITEYSAKGRINVLAIHSKVGNQRNVITVLFKIKKLKAIQDYFTEHYKDKFIMVEEAQ